MVGKGGEIARADFPSKWLVGSVAVEQTACQPKGRNLLDLRVDSTGAHVATNIRYPDSKHSLLDVNRLAPFEGIAKFLAVRGRT
jgi:hypothetical protein